MTKTKAIVVPWEPKAALDGMMTLSPMAELAYRRLLDCLYSTGGELPDDDDKLAWMTKAGTKNAWSKIKRELLAEGKITVKDGVLTNEKCTEILSKIDAKREQKKRAGKKSADERKKKTKPLEDNETASTDVEISLPEKGSETATEGATEPPTDGQPSHLTNEPSKKEEEEKGEIQQTTAQDLRTDALDIPTDLKRHWTDAEKDRLFDQFWEAYPRKSDNEGAFYAFWAAVERERVQPQLLIACAEFYAAEMASTETRHIKIPVKWLSENRFKDCQAAVSRGEQPRQPSGGGAVTDALDRLESDLAEGRVA